MKVTLKEIATINAGQNAPQGDEKYCENGIPFVKAGNLQELIDGKSLNDIQKVSYEVAEEYKLKLFKEGTILFAKSGMSCMKGLVYVLPRDSYVVSHLACVAPNSSLSDYLKYYFLYNRPNHLVKDSAYPSISLADIGDIEIELCSLKEREKIVNQLKKLEQVIKLNKLSIKKHDDLIKARFVEMFGNPVINDKEWKQESLGRLATKIGSGATPKGGKETYREDGIALIRSMNVHNGQFEYKDLAHISYEQASQLDNVTIEENDILLNITGASVARCCIAPADILPARVNQHVCIVRCKGSIMPNFLSFLLIDDNYQDLLWSIAGGGATREAITKQQIENLQIILPPIELQQQFANFAKQVDKSKLAVQQSLEKTQQLFDSLMQEYFG